MRFIEPTFEYESQICDYRQEFLDEGGSMDGTGALRRMENPKEWIEYCILSKKKETAPDGLVPATQYIYVKEDDSSFLANVAVIELMARTKQVLSAANRYNGLNLINVSDVFVLFGLAATIYFVINFSISMTVRNLQKKKMTVKVKKTPVLEERRQTGWAYNG
ncbi:MAG: hypothetical protein J5959_10840 [Butyrivibrio sp.]|nr:hypothetical protein [Butyrivibrio sp.]